MPAPSQGQTRASQLGIGVVAARIVEMIGRNEGAVVPIGSYQARFGVTLSLPSHVGREGVTRVLMPTLADVEARALDESAATLRRALQSIEQRSSASRDAVVGIAIVDSRAHRGRRQQVT